MTTAASKRVLDQRGEFFIPMTPSVRTLIYSCIGIGLVAFGAGLMSGDQTRTWGSFLFNLIFFFSIALAGAAFGSMQDVMSAKWARPVKRLHESFASFIPWAVGMIVLFLICIKARVLGADRVYNWIADPHLLHAFPGKNVWLTENFMLIRVGLAALTIWWLVRWSQNQMIERDLAYARGDDQSGERLAMKAFTNLSYWSPGILIVYALLFSLICFDLTMSLHPTWFSTLWGGWSFAIMMQCMFALTLILMFTYKDTVLGRYFQRGHFHDIGKMVFGFTVFYAYLTYAHVLTYWYTNIPEETSYYIVRLKSPWRLIMQILPFLTFAIPFFVLIPKASKWVKSVAVPVAGLIIFAQWLSYFMIVMPEVHKVDAAFLPWIEVGVSIGFFGLFSLSFHRFAERVPMLAIGDPLLYEALDSHH